MLSLAPVLPGSFLFLVSLKWEAPSILKEDCFGMFSVEHTCLFRGINLTGEEYTRQ